MSCVVVLQLACDPQTLPSAEGVQKLGERFYQALKLRLALNDSWQNERFLFS